MRKFLIAFVASIAVMQSAYAIPSALNESIRENQAILDSDLLPEAVGQGEFIVDIRRITKKVNVLGTVFYVLRTRLPVELCGLEDELAAVIEEETEELGHHHSHSHHHSHHSKKHHHQNRPDNRLFARYKVELLIEPNPEIGPNIVTVVNITPIVKNNNRSE